MNDSGMRPHTVAFMDFGTNSVRLLVVRIEPNQAYTVLHALKETVRLGEGEFARQHLQPQAIERAIAVAARFADIARAAGAEEIVAVATAAVREAENRRAFLARLFNETGIDLHVVSGREEARLIFLGVAGGIDLGDRTALLIDIGGGSTETSVGSRHEAMYLNSLKLGAVRLSSLFPPRPDGVYEPEDYQRIKTAIRNEASRTLAELRGFSVDVAVGSSGTIENLGDVCFRAFRDRPRQPQDLLTYDELTHGITMLCSMTLEERRRVEGINPLRADIIVGGAAILDCLMKDLGLDEIRISDRGLRDGLLLDYLARHGHADVSHEVSVRFRSVLQLGRACRFNEEHARQTAYLALRLFDSAADAGLHEFGERERELLEYAAYLHHIGSFLTYSGYQKHSHYLVRNAELLGFDDYESSFMSLIVLYHRGSLRQNKDADFATLSSADQGSLFLLSTLLRMAEHLDRGQAGVIKDVGFHVKGSKRIVLDLQTDRDAAVELAALESQQHVIERVLGKKLETNLTAAAV
jgi:exopolyphosphatase/guanosine-5'-triphosphate,3'-diphosphate pyrophosphatase